MYCVNDPCKSKATHAAIHYNRDGSEFRRIHLCATCANAYIWGQASPKAKIIPFCLYPAAFCTKVYNIQEVLGWEFPSYPAYDLCNWAWEEFAEDHPILAKQYRHNWMSDFEIVGNELTVYLFKEEEQCHSTTK